MEDRRRMPSGDDALFKPRERVAILGEHDRRLAHPREEPQQETDLALVARSSPGGLGDGREPATFPLRVGQARHREGRGWRVILERVFVFRRGERQTQLPRIVGAAIAQQRHPSLDRGRERAGARERALAEQNRHQARAVVAAPAGFLP